MILVLCLTIVSCTRFRLQEESPEKFIPRDTPKWIKMETVDGVKTELFRPEIRSDSLTGLLVEPAPGGSVAEERVAIELAKVERVWAKKFSPGLTVLAVASGPALIALIGWISLNYEGT